MSFGKPAASFSNIYLAPPTFAFFLILSLFISLPSASFSEETSDNIEFDLDYGVQSRICEEIPTLIESGLKNLLSKYFEGISPGFNFLEVRFDNPGASSLNLMVVIHANGKCANRHEENRKEIQKALVQICNTNNLTIPFNQLTINMADGAQGSNPPLG